MTVQKEGCILQLPVDLLSRAAMLQKAELSTKTCARVVSCNTNMMYESRHVRAHACYLVAPMPRSQQEA